MLSYNKYASNSSGNLPDEVLLQSEINSYTKSFQQLSNWLPTHMTWYLGYEGTPRQISLPDKKVASLNAHETAIIVLWIVAWIDSTRLHRISHQNRILTLQILNLRDVILHDDWMMKIANNEHRVSAKFLENLEENAANIFILRRAYEMLQHIRTSWQVLDIEWKMLLGRIVALLWGKYRLRPYMIDRELRTDSWIDYFDHLLHDFSEESYQLAVREWYPKTWWLCLRVRDDIARMKWIPTIFERMYTDHSSQEANKAIMVAMRREIY